MNLVIPDLTRNPANRESSPKPIRRALNIIPAFAGMMFVLLARRINVIRQITFEKLPGFFGRLFVEYFYK